MQEDLPSERATTIDYRVGAQLRACRLERGVSQGALGRALGVTPQQVQKYEAATNRLSPGRLVLAAEFLDAPLARFFAPLPYAHPDPCAAERARWAGAFDRLPAGVRATVIRIAKRMRP